MDEEQLYQEYLKQKQAGVEKPSVQDLMKQNLASEEQIARGLENAASVMSGGLTQAIPALGRSALARIGASAAEGGAMGAVQDKEDRLRGFLTGALAQGGMRGVGEGLGKVADVGMQMAVGRKKYTPGVGQELADAGLIGSQGMLQKQTQKGLRRTGADMQKVASEIQAPISARRIGQEIGEETTAPLTGGWTVQPSQRDVGTVNDLLNFAEDVASRGDETAVQALARRRAAGSSAYSQRTGDPKLAPLAQASKLEQAKYSQALKEADPRMIPLDTRYAALKKAEKGLADEPSIPRSLLGIASMTSKSIPGGSLVTSGISQAASKGGKLAEFLAPLTRQATIAEPQDEEERLYQEYLRSKGY